jgi:hypothetical protein
MVKIQLVALAAAALIFVFESLKLSPTALVHFWNPSGSRERRKSKTIINFFRESIGYI